MGDSVALIIHRKNVIWKYLLALIPWVMFGLVGGYFVLRYLNSEQLQPLIGILVLGLIALHMVRERFGERFNEALPDSNVFSVFTGILGGFTTMIGSAGGGVMSIYLLVKELPKHQFMGITAWFFFIVNMIKVPFYLSLDMITIESLTFNLKLVPVILIGSTIGYKLLPYIPQKVFQTLVLILAAVGGFNLLF